jgi:predicted nucleic-acid-binding protein
MTAEAIFADTNLFLRYLTNDIPDQAEQVNSLLARAARQEIRLVINSLVIAELVWTMESFYNLSRDDIKAKILAILATPGLNVEHSDAVIQAIFWYVEKNVDYIDAFHAAWWLVQGENRVLTYNIKHFKRFEFLVVDSPDTF